METVSGKREVRYCRHAVAMLAGDGAETVDVLPEQG